MTYEELAAEMGVLYHGAKDWMDEDEEAFHPCEGVAWDQNEADPGGIEPPLYKILRND